MSDGARSDLPKPRRACAIVVGLGVNGLGVVRSLAKARVPTIVLDNDLDVASCTTWLACKKRIGTLAGPELVKALLDIRRKLPLDPVLILTQEASVETISASRHELDDCLRISMPDAGTMRALLDKVEFQRLAEEGGFPIPRSVRLTREVRAEVTANLKFPCVLKPTTKDSSWAREFQKAYKVTRVGEVAALWERMREIVGEVIVQEWIEGGDSDVHFCLQYRAPVGGPVTSFVGRKLRQWPPLVGGTASCVAAPEAAAELEDLTNRFFGEVGMVGLCSMEYKRDLRDGRFYMVEPTVGRTDFQEEIATLNGVNIPFAAYCGELGLPLRSVRRVRRAVGWRDPIGDSQTRAVSGTAAVKPGVALRNAYWRWYDPMPFVALQLERAWGRWSRLGGRRRQALNAN